MANQLLSCYRENVVEAGLDEAGRGCLAGPVFAAAVILPPTYHHQLLTDSKQLSRHNREQLREEIERRAISWAVCMADNDEIDRINILNASILAMHRAIDKLTVKPGLLLVDGNRFKEYQNLTHVCIIKGDTKYYSIAAASILAKTYRDEFMESAHKKYPLYFWNQNKGYPTKKHRACIVEHGISPLHRKTFKLQPNQHGINF